ncbi:hypothetical protein BH23ACT5_BH23ACT5_00250 [soil metagenome]
MLPYLDEHTTAIETDPGDVWRALLEAVDGAFSRRRAIAYARIVGCDPRTASGPRPLQRGATIPGFRVVAADAACELVLEGRHRFSTYALTFRLEQVDSGRSRLRAETRAAFVGVPGFVYRLLVVGTGGHVRAVQRLLASIRRRAEGCTPTRA